LNLTKKEVQIAVLVRDGKTSKEIAEIVNVSKSDVDFHRGKLREKLGLKNQKGSLTVLLRTLSHEGPRERP
jgi:DNA-binding CsgD family transcriptional regulator